MNTESLKALEKELDNTVRILDAQVSKARRDLISVRKQIRQQLTKTLKLKWRNKKGAHTLYQGKKEMAVVKYMPRVPMCTNLENNEHDCDWSCHRESTPYWSVYIVNSHGLTASNLEEAKKSAIDEVCKRL